MTIRIHGSTSAQQSITGELQFYTVYCVSLGAYSDPNPNPPSFETEVRQLNIHVTDEIKDESQKNFEILFQSIGLRATPTIMNNPEAVLDLAQSGSLMLAGEGFVWKFAVERLNAWEDFRLNDPIGLLIKELDGVIIESGIRITTVDGSPSAVDKNIEFIRTDTI